MSISSCVRWWNKSNTYRSIKVGIILITKDLAMDMGLGTNGHQSASLSDVMGVSTGSASQLISRVRRETSHGTFTSAGFGHGQYPNFVYREMRTVYRGSEMNT